MKGVEGEGKEVRGRMKPGRKAEKKERKEGSGKRTHQTPPNATITQLHRTKGWQGGSHGRMRAAGRGICMVVTGGRVFQQVDKDAREQDRNAPEVAAREIYPTSIVGCGYTFHRHRRAKICGRQGCKISIIRKLDKKAHAPRHWGGSFIWAQQQRMDTWWARSALEQKSGSRGAKVAEMRKPSEKIDLNEDGLSMIEGGDR
jgi:hypothetical protein